MLSAAEFYGGKGLAFVILLNFLKIFYILQLSDVLKTTLQYEPPETLYYTRNVLVYLSITPYGMTVSNDKVEK